MPLPVACTQLMSRFMKPRGGCGEGGASTDVGGSFVALLQTVWATAGETVVDAIPA